MNLSMRSHHRDGYWNFLIFFRKIIELTGSMRFAISLFILICLIGIVGTLVEQNQESNWYIEQFGFFWFNVFQKLYIYNIFSSPYFLFSIGFLILSITVCLIKNSPRMFREITSFQLDIKTFTLYSLPNSIEIRSSYKVDILQSKLKKLLQDSGYSFREKHKVDGILLAAKKGSLNRAGYILSHFSVILICLGGCIDSQIPLKMQILLNKKQPIFSNMLISDVPESGKLSVRNPSYNSTAFVSENAKISSGIVRFRDGIFIQKLPFELRLKQFITEHHPDGVPRKFFSLVEITDLDSGVVFDSEIQVNKPISLKGVRVYQSGFSDSGSQVNLTGYQLNDPKTNLQIQAKIGEWFTHSYIGSDGLVKKSEIYLKDFHKISMNNLPDVDCEKKEDFASKCLAALIGNAGPRKKDNLRDLGPVLHYSLKNHLGEIYNFHTYMMPISVQESSKAALIGIKKDSWSSMYFLKIPTDIDGDFGKFITIRNKLMDPLTRRTEINQFFERMDTYEKMDKKALAIFMDDILKILAHEGLQSVFDFLEKHLEPSQLESSQSVIMRLTASILAQLYENNEIHTHIGTHHKNEVPESWVHLAIIAMSDLAVLDDPSLVFFLLKGFQHKQASIFQINKTLGEKFVYFGLALMISGIFLMLYLRNYRIWLYIKSDGFNGSIVHFSMRLNQHKYSCINEFKKMKNTFLEKIR